MRPLEEAVRACEDRRRLADAVARKDRALWRLVREEGLTPAMASARLVEELRARGFTPDEVQACGVSPASVKAAARRFPT